MYFNRKLVQRMRSQMHVAVVTFFLLGYTLGVIVGRM